MILEVSQRHSFFLWIVEHASIVKLIHTRYMAASFVGSNASDPVENSAPLQRFERYEIMVLNRPIDNVGAWLRLLEYMLQV